MVNSKLSLLLYGVFLWQKNNQTKHHLQSVLLNNLQRVKPRENVHGFLNFSLENEKKDSFDGVLESCVFQHLNEIDRKKAFQEAVRVLKRGGVFIGHMLSQNHTTYQLNKGSIKETERGTLVLKSEEAKNKINFFIIFLLIIL